MFAHILYFWIENNHRNTLMVLPTNVQGIFSQPWLMFRKGVWPFILSNVAKENSLLFINDLRHLINTGNDRVSICTMQQWICGLFLSLSFSPIGLAFIPLLLSVLLLKVLNVNGQLNKIKVQVGRVWRKASVYSHVTSEWMFPSADILPADNEGDFHPLRGRQLLGLWPSQRICTLCSWGTIIYCTVKHSSYLVLQKKMRWWVWKQRWDKMTCREVKILKVVGLSVPLPLWVM